MVSTFIIQDTGDVICEKHELEEPVQRNEKNVENSTKQVTLNGDLCFQKHLYEKILLNLYSTLGLVIS